jgi:predicted NBD/HSP70 family sugar kinase
MVSARYPGRNVSAVKSHNIRAILLNLLYNEPAYRVKLAREIAVSTTTVAKLVDELISQGLIEERAEDINGRRSVGRPQNALYLVRDARNAIGIHIGGGIFRVAVVNLRNEIIQHKFGYFDLMTPAEEVFTKIVESVNQVIDECGVCRERIVGVGVGAPGLVNLETGMIGFAKNLGWRDVPLCDWFTQKLDMPIIIENNVRAMALGEAVFGAGRDVSSLLFVYGRLGVAAGIVADHQIYRGSSLGAGEIGHNYIIQENGAGDQLGERVTLENLVSAPALVRQAKVLCEQHPESILSEQLNNSDTTRIIDKIFAAARQGDVHAQALVEKSARYLGLSLVNAINFINPELILLGGMFAQEKDFYLPILREMADEYSFAALGKQVGIQETSFGWRAGLLGASTLALTHFFYLPPEDIR